MAWHFPRGVKSLEPFEVRGIPQDRGGWRMGSGEQGRPPPKARLPYEERVERQWPACGARRDYGARARGVDCLGPRLALVKAA